MCDDLLQEKFLRAAGLERFDGHLGQHAGILARATHNASVYLAKLANADAPDNFKVLPGGFP